MMVRSLSRMFALSRKQTAMKRYRLSFPDYSLRVKPDLGFFSSAFNRRKRRRVQISRMKCQGLNPTRKKDREKTERKNKQEIFYVTDTRTISAVGHRRLTDC